MTERRSPNVFSLGDTLTIAGVETRIVRIHTQPTERVVTTGNTYWTYPQLVKAIRAGALDRVSEAEEAA